MIEERGYIYIYCDECGALKDTLSWPLSARQVEESIKSDHEEWTVRFVSEKLICDECLPKFCLHPHPVDNHFCLCYAGHETDHECCKRHMFY